MGTTRSDTIVLTPHVLAGMVSLADTEFPRETGGLLMGHYQQERPVVTDMIGPGPNAVARPTEFTPDRDWQYARIDELFERTAGTIRFLGEWHSHPNGRPQLSHLDRSLLRQISRSAASQCPCPVLGILFGGPGVHWEIAFTRYASRGPLLSRLAPLEYRIRDV